MLLLNGSFQELLTNVWTSNGLVAQHNVDYGAGNEGVDFYVFDPTGSPSDRLTNSGAISDFMTSKTTACALTAM